MHVERSSQGVDVIQTDVPFAPLDPADVVAVQAGPFGQTLLGQAPIVAETADSPPEGQAMGGDGSGRPGGHARGIVGFARVLVYTL